MRDSLGYTAFKLSLFCGLTGEFENILSDLLGLASLCKVVLF